MATLLGSAFTFALTPLFFEYSVELLYPNPEGLVGGFLTFFYNLIGTIFLSVFLDPNAGTKWMNYLLVVGAIGKV